MDYDAIAKQLIDEAQSAYVADLSSYFLRAFKDFSANDFNEYDRARLAQLSRLNSAETMRIFQQHKDKIDRTIKQAVNRAIKDEDGRFLGLFKQAAGSRRHVTNYADIVAQQATRGMSEIFYRQNIALAEQQAQLWYEVTAETISRAQSGEPYKQVMERGVTKLTDAGLETIDYVSGVRTSVDAALRRHIVTQANQARNRLLMQRMDEWDWDLVYTSAHYGARPTHAVWQGKVYSRSGTSSRYPGLVEATGYGTVTGLCGANCRHEMYPYVEGLSKLPDTKFESQVAYFGKSSDERYKDIQKQRRMERIIRSAKREKLAMESVGLDNAKQAVHVRELQTKLRAHIIENKLTRDYARERVFGLRSNSHITGAIYQSGGLNNKNDPDYAKRDAHAARYYASIRRRNLTTEASVIADNTGLEKEEIYAALNHVFIDKHQLDGGERRFDPDFDMSQSWQRLRDGNNIQEHDMLLIRHEIYEYHLMHDNGLNYNSAHRKAEKLYNYSKSVRKWNKERGA